MEFDGTVIQEDGFGFVPRNFVTDSDDKSSRIVRRYTMTNKNAASVRLISWGAGVQSIRVPSSRDILGDVVFGFDDIKGYFENRYLGRVINNVGNCPSNTFGKDYFEMHTNEKYRSHEKIDNLDNVNWESFVLGQQVIMSHVKRTRKSERGADLLIQVKYSWSDKNELDINIRATATKSVPANMTVLCPMNLAGHAMGAKELMNHIVTINTDDLGPIDNGQNWFNQVSKINPTFYNLRIPTRLKNRLYQISGGGFNRNLRINSPSDWCYRFHARILHPESGRLMEIYSNRSYLNFSTLNNFPNFEPRCVANVGNRFWGAGGDVLDGKTLMDQEMSEENSFVRGKDGALYGRHGGFIFAPQSDWDEKFTYENILHPGEVFHHDLSYKFGSKSRDR